MKKLTNKEKINLITLITAEINRLENYVMDTPGESEELKERLNMLYGLHVKTIKYF